MLWAFAGIAAVVTVTPGAATAMVVRSALRGGWRAGLRTIAGNEIGVVAWGLVFFVALFPQFVGARATVLPTTLLMAGLIVAFDFAWYTALAVVVSRARRSYMGSRLARWVERVTGTVLAASACGWRSSRADRRRHTSQTSFPPSTASTPYAPFVVWPSRSSE